MMKNSLKLYQNKILKKPFLSLLLLYLAMTFLLLFVGLYYYNFQKERIINSRFEYLGSMAGFRSSQIENWLADKYSDLQIIKVSTPLTDLSRKKFSAAEGITPIVLNWFEMLKKFYRYDNVMLFSRSFAFMYGLVTPRLPLAKSDSLLIQTAIDSNAVIFSDSNEKTADQNLLRFFIPIESQNVSPSGIGVLVITIDPRTTFEPILNRNIDKSPTMESLLVKAINDSVAYLNRLRYSNRMIESKYDDPNKALYKTSPITNMRGFVTGVDYKNDEVIAYMQKIPSTAWFLITKLNRSEFYSPVNNLARLVLLVVISSDLLLALILFFIWRKNIVANVRKIYRAETEKLKIEKRFETLVNGVRDFAIVVLDRNGNVMSWNKGAEKIKGYSADEIVGKHISIFYPEEERLKNKSAWMLNEAVKSGNVQVEAWRVRKNGSFFWANVVITSLSDENGEVYGFLKITRDLTEKRKNEEDLKNSRDFYLKLLDDFPNPVWRSDPNGNCNYFNKAWLSFTGRSIEENIGYGWVSSVHPDDKERVLKEYSEAFKLQKSFTSEFRLQDSHGEYRWIIEFGMPYYDFNNHYSGYLGSCYDINDRKKYEDTINTLLSISEKLYSSLEIDQITDSLVTESIKLTNAESGFACIKSESVFESKRYYYKDHWEYLNKVCTTDSPILQKFVNSRYSCISNDTDKNSLIDNDLIGKYKIRQALSTPLFDSSGELIGFFELHNKGNNKVFANDDINLLRGVARNASISIAKSLAYEKLRKTEYRLRSSESELRNLAAQIQYARESERQSIAREVHDELGQLFTGINLNISLLIELLEQTEKPAITEILDELNSVQEFVKKGIQAVRDISSSLRSYVLDHLGLIPAVQEYCREIERISNITCNFSSDLETFNLDDERNVALFRIIQEALTNVIRHADASLIDVRIYQANDNLGISISDNGKGMSSGSESLSNSMGILGMKERTIFVGGKLNIDSAPDKGTCITLLIPVDPKEKVKV